MSRLAPVPRTNTPDFPRLVGNAVNDLLSRADLAVNVKTFKATGDGVTDDTAAIQAAIDAVSDAGGGSVLFPAGSYLTGTLSLPEDVSLRGQGKYATRLIATSGLDDNLIERIGTLLAPINRGGVESMTIVGSGKADTSMIGIKCVYTNRTTLRDVDVFACRVGVYAENVWQDAWDNVHVHGDGGDQNYIGFHMGPRAAVVGVSNAVNAVNCIAQGVEKYGWRIENCNGSAFTNCQGMDGETSWYIGAPLSGTENLEFALFNNCQGDTNSSYVWRIERGSAVEVKQLQFVNCWAASSGASAVWVADCSNLTLSNWQIVSAVGHGIHFDGSARCSVSNCNIRSYNNATGANSGILLEDSLVISLHGNQIYTATTGTGKSVTEIGTANYNMVIGNALSGGSTIIGANSVSANNVTI